MSKKLSKRILSVLLSVLMVISSIPFFAFSATANDMGGYAVGDDNDPNMIAANSAYTVYEDAMDGTIYRNMSESYWLYTKLHAMVDRYLNTGSDTYNKTINGTQVNYTITGLAQQLTTATNTMKANKFVSYTGSAFGKSNGDDQKSGDTTYTTDADYLQTNVNLLYTTNITSGSNGVANTGDLWIKKSAWNSLWSARACGRIFYPVNTVMLYDGKTAPRFPIMVRNDAWQDGGTSMGSVTHIAAYLDNNSGNGLTFYYQDWRGRGGTADVQWMLLEENKGKDDNYYLATADNAPDSWYKGKDKYSYYANMLTFSNSSNSVMSATEGCRTIVPSLTFRWGIDDAIQYKTYGTATPASDQGVYVLNYKRLLDKINSTTSYLSNVENYGHGGLDDQGLFEAIDAATSYNISTINFAPEGSQTTAQKVAAVADVIKDKMDAIDTGLSNMVMDTNTFTNMAACVKDNTATYNRGNADSTYAATDWERFTDAYEAAYTLVEDLPKDLYKNVDDVAAAHTELLAARAGLVAIGKADTTDLEIAINNGLSAIANSSIWTTASFNASELVTLVPAAQAAVWGSVENYGVDAEKLADNDKNNGIIDDHCDAIVAGIAKLVVNVSAISLGIGQSLVDAKNAAAEYALPANRNQYANIQIVDTAIENADNFITSGNTAIDGTIADAVFNRVKLYNTLVSGLRNAIKQLRFSFVLMADGTMVYPGLPAITQMDSTHTNSYGNWQLRWERNSGMIYFRTKHTEFNLEMPDSTITFKNKTSYDALLDGLTLMAIDTTSVPEIVADRTQSNAIIDSGWIGSHTPTLTVNNAGIDYTFTSLTLRNIGGPSDGYGRDIHGTMINDLSHNWIPELSTIEGGNDGNGNFLFAGGPTVKNGTNTYTLKSTITMEATSDELSATTRPTLSSWNSGTNGGFGGTMAYTYYWSYYTFPSRWYGYGYDTMPYAQVINVVDVAPLIDLIKWCEGQNYVSTDYTTTSWNAYTTALGNARAEFEEVTNYEQGLIDTVNVTQIKNEAITRYNNLWAARKPVACANNDNLKAAVQAAADAYANDADKCDPTSFQAFRQAYQAANSKYLGDYSDLNIRQFTKGSPEEQDANALATALTDAFNNLKYYADFTALDLAAANFAAGVETKKYSVATLNTLANTLATLPYLSKTAAQRAQCFRTANVDTDDQRQIDAEAESIADLADTLVASDYDDSALQEAIKAVKAKYADPDAWDGVNAAVAAIESSWYQDVNIYKDVTVKGIAYNTQEEIDAAVTEIQSLQVKPQKYTVSVDGISKGQYNYGELVTVTSDSGKEVNWYYSYTSNSTNNEYLDGANQEQRKFYATDVSIQFVVKGNTNLTTSAVKDSNSNRIKITYKSALNGKPYGVDYVDKNVATELSSLSDGGNPPSFAHFAFTNYTDIHGDPITVVDSDEDIVVYANYRYADESTKYTVTLTGLVRNPNYGVDFVKITGLNYNDEVRFCESDLTSTAINNGSTFKIDSTSDSVQVTYLLASGLASPKQGTAEGVDGVYSLPCARQLQANPTALQRAQNHITHWAAFASAEDCNTFLTDAENATYTKKLPGERMTHLSGDGKIGKLHIQAYGSDYIFRVHKDEFLMSLGDFDTHGYYEGQTSINSAALSIRGMLEGYEDAAGVTSADDERCAHKNMAPIIEVKPTIVKGTGKFSMIGTYSLPAGCTEIEAGILFCSNGTATPTNEDLTLSNVGKNGIARFKSSQHTLANQFVISVNTGNMTGPLGMQYAAYIVYKDANNESHIVISDTVTDSFDLA